MQKKVTWILCSLAILACYGCGDDSGSADPAENKGCTFEAAYCDGNVLHTCLNGDEKTETCTGTCNSDQGKCIPGENDKIPECGENRHYDETAGECVDNEPAEHT
ncbi:MAG: hypothetical protein J6A01_05875 [Proteobacteria bacterium]|nr:hypothetical protein [Pseudomonadota bacterium]